MYFSFSFTVMQQSASEKDRSGGRSGQFVKRNYYIYLILIRKVPKKEVNICILNYFPRFSFENINIYIFSTWTI